MLKQMWGLQERSTGRFYANAFATRSDARAHKNGIDCFNELKVVKLLVPVEEEKKKSAKKEEDIDATTLASVAFSQKGVVLVDRKDGIIEPRLFGELSFKALWLDSYEFDWKLVKDSDNELCLVAIRRKNA